MIQRTNSQPGNFSPTKSTIALAVTLLVTLGLAQWYISTKEGAVNTSNLKRVLKEKGLFEFIPDQSYENFYLLYNGDVPVGYKHYKQSWQENNLLKGIEITSIPGLKYASKTEWIISNNTNIWSQQKHERANGIDEFSELHFKTGSLKHLIEGKVYDISGLTISSNLIPPFMLDIYTSIGIQQNTRKLELKLLHDRDVYFMSVEPGDRDSIPLEYKTDYPDGIAVKVSYRDNIQQIYYSKDHQLIYQKNKIPIDYNIISICEEEDILNLLDSLHENNSKYEDQL